MTDMHLYINSVILLLPVCSAATCLLLLFFSWTDNVTKLDRRVKMTLFAYFVAVAGVWTMLFCYVFFPVVFVWVNT